jgi:hypothetical protein
MQKSLVSNVSIDGYNFISQPSNQNAEGMGFYIKDDCELHVRDDFTVSTNDFVHGDSLSVSEQYHICSVIYRLQTSKKCF